MTMSDTEAVANDHHDKVREILNRYLIERGDPLYTTSQAASDIIESLGWSSPADLSARDAAVTAKALQLAAEVIDAYSEHDSAMCCDGRECGCQGTSVHQTIKHYILALQPATTGWSETKSEEALDAADRAHNRLAYYATMAHNGKAELDGREMSRQVWGAFADFYAVKHPHIEKIRATSKAIYDKEHGGEPAPWDRNENAPTGWKLVTEEPDDRQITDAITAAKEHFNHDGDAVYLSIDGYKAIYRAMIGSVK